MAGGVRKPRQSTTKPNQLYTSPSAGGCFFLLFLLGERKRNIAKLTFSGKTKVRNLDGVPFDKHVLGLNVPVEEAVLKKKKKKKKKRRRRRRRKGDVRRKKD